MSTQAVQQVISNLLISHIELRSEESPDIQAHSHQRSLEKVVVPLGESLTAYQTRYVQVGNSEDLILACFSRKGSVAYFLKCLFACPQGGPVYIYFKMSKEGMLL